MGHGQHRIIVMELLLSLCWKGDVCSNVGSFDFHSGNMHSNTACVDDDDDDDDDALIG